MRSRKTAISTEKSRIAEEAIYKSLESPRVGPRDMSGRVLVPGIRPGDIRRSEAVVDVYSHDKR